MIVEHLKHWELPIAGFSVTRCVVDFSFGFELEQGRVAIRIHSPFLFVADNQEFNLSPDVQASLCPVLSIFDKKIVEGKAYKQGTLDFRFSDGSRLSVPPDPNYESWEVGAKAGFLVVCGPGGDLSIWDREMPQ